jgi:hypothetical protein
MNVFTEDPPFLAPVTQFVHRTSDDFAELVPLLLIINGESLLMLLFPRSCRPHERRLADFFTREFAVSSKVGAVQAVGKPCGPIGSCGSAHGRRVAGPAEQLKRRDRRQSSRGVTTT